MSVKLLFKWSLKNITNLFFIGFAVYQFIPYTSFYSDDIFKGRIIILDYVLFNIPYFFGYDALANNIKKGK